MPVRRGGKCERGGCDRPVHARGMCSRHYNREVESARPRHRHREDRVLASRARNRAVAALITAHRDEFEKLYADARAAVAEEHARLEELARANGLDPNNGVVRLRVGPRPDDVPVEDRIRERGPITCPHCSALHQDGHVCAECGITLEVLVEPPRGKRPVDDGVVDDVAIERVLTGQDGRVRLTPGEQLEAVRRMLDADWKRADMCRALGVTHEKVQRLILEATEEEAESA